jgi:hypothetical protein
MKWPADKRYSAKECRGLDGSLRAVLVANNLGAPILPHERDNLGHNLGWINGLRRS